jgi:hypothetical protein
MIPERFIIEYPERCLDLLKVLEPFARRMHLVASFSLLAASSVLTIPFERSKAEHPLRDRERHPGVASALDRIMRQKFAEAELWSGEYPEAWRFTKIQWRPDSTPDDTRSWLGPDHLHPMAAGAQNTIGRKNVRDVFWVIRNALAHGNVIYLDANGVEATGRAVHDIAFLSRRDANDKAKGYSLVAAPEEGFLSLVKCWTRWLTKLPKDERLLFIEAAD